MHNVSVDIEKMRGLRTEAENRLKSGTVPLTRGWTLSADALAVLYKLASNSDSAGAGLKLLHELQAHQVELDLQHEQLEANERDFLQELSRYKSLYECAPVGYFVLTFEGQILETNLEGARLFGTTHQTLPGKRIDAYLAGDSRAPLLALLNKLYNEGGTGFCTVHFAGGVDETCLLRIEANVSPSGEAVLMVVSEYN